MKLHKSQLIMTVSLVISWFFVIFCELRSYEQRNPNLLSFDSDPEFKGRSNGHMNIGLVTMQVLSGVA